MVIDTSAIIAILLSEPEGDRFIRLIGSSRTRLFSAASLVEASLVIESRKGQAGRSDLDLFRRDGGLEIVPVKEAQAQSARTAFRLFGKGRHSARLTFRDCFSYALAKASNEPLRFKGQEFSQTDLPIVTL
jgi:ribonuclease VapC